MSESATQPTSTEPAVGINDMLVAAKVASRSLASLVAEHKNRALEAIAATIEVEASSIVRANERDLDAGREAGLSEALLDRLRLTPARLDGLADAVRQVAALTDPVGEVVRGSTLQNGLMISQVRVPFGVIGVIYEARPNVTVDLAALAIKSGNALVLRGGSAAINSNRVLVSLIQNALASVGLPRDAVATIDEFGRAGATELMKARGLVDVLIPRGSAQLIAAVVDQSTVPVIETGAGVVHLFLDESADRDMAVSIALNAKVQRPSVCNAVETLLVHSGSAARLLPDVLSALVENGVTVHGDDATRALFPDAVLATDEDWSLEHLSLDISVRVVADLDAAIEHIRLYSTHHTESIITNDLANAERFLATVDSAVVMVNSSTRFTDGGEFGFGAEVGVSTQKLHARGPMGLAELTSTKWLVRGTGQARA